MDYADYVCLFSKDREEMKMMTELVVADVNKVGLKMNTRKSEIMRIRSSDNQRVIIDDTYLEEVDNFTYLEREIRNDGNV